MSLKNPAALTKWFYGGNLRSVVKSELRELKTVFGVTFRLNLGGIMNQSLSYSRAVPQQTIFSSIWQMVHE